MERRAPAGILTLVFSIALPASAAYFSDGASFDPRKVTAHRIVQDVTRLTARSPRSTAPKVSLAAAIASQTPVKSQGRRGTCSIFSTTGMLEALIKMRWKREVDLSENYLEFLVVTELKPEPAEGSDVGLNVKGLHRYGDILEARWPYESFDWTARRLPDDELLRREEVCGEETGENLKACYLVHHDPDEDEFRPAADRFLATYETGRLKSRMLDRESEIRSLLARGYPVVLSLQVFFGAWNHRFMTRLGIGKRDPERWKRGQVGTPTEKDVELSSKHAASHSFILVGYDDTKQVYFFKNSWGTGSFGARSDLLGPRTTPGYGSITYAYAHEYGAFYDVFYTDRSGRAIRP